MPLGTIAESLLLAAYFRGMPQGDIVWHSCSDQVVTLSLFYTGNLSAEECAARFSNRPYLRGLYNEAGELQPDIATRYRHLIRLVREHPDLIEGGGDLDHPADPTYTACRLTPAGDELISSLIGQFPAKPEFPNWPDKRLWPSAEADAGQSSLA